MMNRLFIKINACLRSRQFFWVVIGFFVFEAMWFVLSAVYPMAFDEDFHFGLIQLYAQHWSPFLNGQPANANQFGAVARDPSYLYHYLMSFPYRLIRVFAHDETLQIILLRMLNVAMFTTGLYYFAKVMRRAKASKALVNVSLAIFALIPIAPQLAAHINYDNLLMLLLPLFCLVCFDIMDGLNDRQINVRAVLLFVLLSLTMSLVKYPALPFVAVAVLFLAIIFHKSFRGHYRELKPAFARGLRAVSRPMLILLVGSVLLASVLFIQRYGINMIRYKTPVPACNQVLTVKQCSSYGPWARDYSLEQQREALDFTPDVKDFVGDWFYGMWYRLFFAINGAKSSFTNYSGLPVPSWTSIVVATVGFLLMLFYAPQVFKQNRYLVFLITISIVYILALWLDNFTAYSRTGDPVAINGRYLLPILLFVAIAFGRAFSLRFQKAPRIKTAVAVLAILLFLYGGGVFTFILRSDDSWDWPNSTVTHTNNAARKILAPITIDGGRKQ